MRPRHLIGLAFLLVQVGLVIRARFVDTRFFCWAPYDQHTRYRIDVVVGDLELTGSDARRRYGYRTGDWEPRSIDNVFSMIRQYESTYGLADNARVTVTYSTNGHAEATWTWPIH